MIQLQFACCEIIIAKKKNIQFSHSFDATFSSVCKHLIFNAVGMFYFADEIMGCN